MMMNDILEKTDDVDLTGGALNYAVSRVSRYKTGVFFNVVFFLLAGLIIAGTALYIIFMILKSV